MEAAHKKHVHTQHPRCYILIPIHIPVAEIEWMLYAGVLREWLNKCDNACSTPKCECECVSVCVCVLWCVCVCVCYGVYVYNS